MVYVFGHGHDLDVLMLCSFLFPIFDFNYCLLLFFFFYINFCSSFRIHLLFRKRRGLDILNIYGPFY